MTVVYPGWVGCTPGRRGVPGYIPPYVLPAIPPGYIHPVPPWVYTTPAVHGLVYTAYTRPEQCPVITSWALSGRKPWVRASQRL